MSLASYRAAPPRVVFAEGVTPSRDCTISVASGKSSNNLFYLVGILFLLNELHVSTATAAHQVDRCAAVECVWGCLHGDSLAHVLANVATQ